MVTAAPFLFLLSRGFPIYLGQGLGVPTYLGQGWGGVPIYLWSGVGGPYLPWSGVEGPYLPLLRGGDGPFLLTSSSLCSSTQLIVLGDPTSCLLVSVDRQTRTWSVKKICLQYLDYPDYKCIWNQLNGVTDHTLEASRLRHGHSKTHVMHTVLMSRVKVC